MTRNSKGRVMLSERLQKRLVCPICHTALINHNDSWECTNPGCNAAYPSLHGVPILINERNSLFSISDYFTAPITNGEGVSDFNRVNSLLPSISKNYKTEANFQKFIERLLLFSPNPAVLVIGGKIEGKGMQIFHSYPEIELVSSDIAFGACTNIISDAHDIPFDSETFDGVVVQAVLEHVCDPYRCVDEIHRVLKPEGLVYAETPFMQQVHEGPYDFTRFTHLGHRRLFRKFLEIDSGIVCGPGMAYAWSYRYFLLSFFQSNILRRLVSIWARLTAFFWKYFDAYLISQPGGYDSSSGFYFFGQRSEQVLSDRQLIKLYRGQINNQGY